MCYLYTTYNNCSTQCLTEAPTVIVHAQVLSKLSPKMHQLPRHYCKYIAQTLHKSWVIFQEMIHIAHGRESRQSNEKNITNRKSLPNIRQTSILTYILMTRSNVSLSFFLLSFKTRSFNRGGWVGSNSTPTQNKSFHCKIKKITKSMSLPINILYENFSTEAG